MNVYIAGRTYANTAITEVEDVVENLGHEITFKWWLADEEQNWRIDQGIAADLAGRERQAVWEADLLILCYAEDLLGGLIETGIAIGEDKDVYILNAFRESVFWHLPNVYLLRDIEELKVALRHERYRWLT
jgi:hypothetical protein